MSVWGACALKYINLIQRPQNGAARGVTGIFDYNQSVSAITNSLNWMTVKNRYFYFLGIFVYKCLYNIAPSPLVERFNVMDDSRPYHTRAVSNKDLIIPHYHLSICKTSISYSGATFWNSLPIEVRGSSSLSIFKHMSKHYIMSNR